MTSASAGPLDERRFRLDSRVAIVTGGAGEIGAAIARTFAAAGARVACLDLDAEQAEATAAAIRDTGAWALGAACDVASDAAVASAVARVAAEAGAPTVLVNTAATLDRTGTILDVDLVEWEKVHRVNLTGAFLMSRAVLPLMIAAGGGSIIHLSSNLGSLGVPGRVSYASTKSALLQLARSMAVDHAAQGIRVNTISPGPIATPRVSYRFAELTPEQREQRVARIPLGRIGEPAEVATAALFLASEAASFITGVDLPVDGGFAGSAG